MSSDLSQHKSKIHQSKIHWPKIHWIGAGLASGPGIVSLANKWGQITVWDANLDRAEKLRAHVAQDAELAIRHLNLKEPGSQKTFLGALKPGDIIVSMLPASFHLQVAKIALEEKCHMVTSSYLCSDMVAFNDEARAKGLSLVNEVGLDPGIDHLLAHIIVDKAQRAGLLNQGHIIDFISYCGGIPAEKNPFTYKFSWTPLGVLTALTSPSIMIKDGKEHITKKAWEDVTELSLGREIFEIYANRNSLPYIKDYGLENETGLQTFVRGTLRLEGWKKAWRDIFPIIENAAPDELKTLSDRLWQAHQYDENEQDRVVLHVALTISPKDGPAWKAALSLDTTGAGWQSAMAQAVSLTVAQAVGALMEKRLPSGVQIAPHTTEEARIWLKGLKEAGLEIKAENIKLPF
ncbi:MAG: saccharopine dehydrogenase NADP-binding domain-containing protein [Emcibacter sp.]|nr:saccharopine dehydrogenase NADP-binding domain-containing protein [Emcibacter sp.]